MVSLFTKVLFFLAAISMISVLADDRFSCCMAGWKVIRGVTLCPAPCCHGYEERILDLPLLQRPSLCQKLTEEEMAQRDRMHEVVREKIILQKMKPKIHMQQIVNKQNWDFIPHDETPMMVGAKIMPLRNSVQNEVYQMAANDEPHGPHGSEKAASEFEEFLFKNQNLFVRFLEEGITRKELIAAFEEFLKQVLKNDVARS
ncbi:UNVERIFIED_CONTAM: hypothetical protein RMT77_001040 [Armadillidium vulgare]